MQTGIFVLSQDITNTRPDRRTRHDWLKAQVWKKGTRFVIHACPWMDRDISKASPKAGSKTYQIAPIDMGPQAPAYMFERPDGTLIYSAHNGQEGVLNLLHLKLEAAETVSDKLDWIFRSRGVSLNGLGGNILHRLVCEGTLTLEEVQKAVEADLAFEQSDMTQDEEMYCDSRCTPPSKGENCIDDPK